MTRLSDQLGTLLGDAFSAMDLDPSLGRVSESDRPDLAPYQCNGALAAAKAAGKPPRVIAEGVVAYLAGTDEIIERAQTLINRDLGMG